MPSLADVIFLVCVVAAVKIGSVMLSADGDPARHLVVGEYILASGSIPRQDVFSHTMAGQPFVPYEWLAEAASAASYRLAALAGPVLLHGAAIGLAFTILFRHLRSRGSPALLALGVVGLAIVASFVHWLARPHVFTFLGAAAFSAILDGWHVGRPRTRWLWVLPPAMALWVNAHGGFLIGLLLIGAYAGGDILRWLGADRETAAAARGRLAQLLLPALATLAATALNPAGPALLAHVTGYFGQRLLVDRTQEYMSPNFHRVNVLPFVMMLLATVAAVAWSRRRPALHEGLLFVGFTYFALYAGRNIPLFAIVVAPLLAAQLAALPRPRDETADGRRQTAEDSRDETTVGSRQSADDGVRTPDARREAAVRRPPSAVRRPPSAVWAWLVRRNETCTRMDGRASGHLWPVVAVAGLILVGAAQQRAGLAPLGVQFDSARHPVAAAAYLQANPPAGNGFNELAWGGYLLRTLWPAQRVFIDGQTDFYGEALARDYLTVTDLAAGWDGVLDRYGVRWVIYPTDSPLMRQLVAMPEWRVAYQDGVATVLIRAQGNGYER